MTKTLKFLSPFSAVLLLIAASIPASAQRKPRIAVLDFDYGTVRSYVQAYFGTDVDLGKGITQMLVTNLVKDGSYTMIDRAAMDKILAEQNFSNSNRADPSSAAKIGKLLGVDAIIVGTITEFGNETKNQGLAGGGGSGWTGALAGIHHSKSSTNVGLNARIINVDTGEIMGVAEGTGTSSRSSTGLGGGGGNWNGHGGGAVDFGSSNFQNTIIGEATKAAVEKLTTDVIADAPKVSVRSISVEGVVAAVDSGQIILNIGKKSGVKVGDQFTVLRVTKEIKDPSTGAVLRKLTTNVGVIKATDVDDISAVCSPVSGTDFKVGDTIKTVMQ
ncbi:CsgG/HfaB family protein [Terracidiphilus gabretensis]|uniref:CsgG/HfaB family protein n=1 Tax=Terracidiphilus gabretensis TaxID=1577687 RepID=UPI0012FC60C4|nr:CsgG/HfaB family protein [Terracidiphilus gabretensis]